MVDAARGSAEAGLAGVAVDEVELAPHHDARAGLLALLNHEGAVLEAEVLVVLRKHEGEYALFEAVDGARLGVAEHEDVAADGVAVEVAEEEDLARLLRLLHHQLGVVVDGVEFGAGADPLPVQVLPHQRAAVVADDDPVGVEHGDYFDYEGVAQAVGLLVVADQEVDHPLHHPGGVGLAGVDARSEDDGLPNGYVLGDAGEVGHDEHVHVVTGETLAEDGLAHLVLVLEGAGLVDETAEVSVGVGVAVSEVDGVLVVARRVLEGEGEVHGAVTVVGLLQVGVVGVLDLVGAEVERGAELGQVLVLVSFLRPSRLVVGDVLAVALPPHLVLLGVMQGVGERAHSLVVGGVGLHEVDQVEAVGAVLARVPDAEVVPLAEALRPVIVLHVQVVLVRPHLQRLPQIPALEPRLENQGLVRRQRLLLRPLRLVL
mmetsp:Transcript_18273/g.31255  ORF Transcript_18273/g.31255 Transcript_18273/m.31255 type:complete len:430 (+) Transcript_18273:217-1506(+)